MLSDKLFKFRLETGQAGFFDFVKQGLVEVNKLIEQNEGLLAEFGAKLSAGLISATKGIIIGSATIIQAIKPVFSFVGSAVLNLFDVFKSLPSGVQTFGLIGFLMLGRLGKGILLLIGGVFDSIRGFLGDLTNAYAFFLEKLVNALEFFKIFPERVKNGRIVIEDFRKAAEKLKTPMKDLKDETMGANKELDSSIGKLKVFLNSLEAKALISKKQVEELLNKLKGSTEETKNLGVELDKVAEGVLEIIKKDVESINQTIAKGVVGGIKSFSRGLAESIVLGKDLENTMKQIAQRILIEVLATFIQFIIQQKILNKFKKDELNTNKNIESSLKRQIALQAVLMAMGGGGGFGIPFFHKGGAVSKGKPIIVGERGPELFVPNQTGQITQSARGTGGGPVNVNFNITTVDARSFDQLLVQRRGTISRIINESVNERGREAII